MLNISDEETIQMFKENLYNQYFIGCDGFTSKAPFNSSLFVEIRRRMSMDLLKRTNSVIYHAATGYWAADTDKANDDSDNDKKKGVEGCTE
jgi:hypothetical protein